MQHFDRGAVSLNIRLIVKVARDKVAFSDSTGRRVGDNQTVRVLVAVDRVNRRTDGRTMVQVPKKCSHLKPK